MLIPGIPHFRSIPRQQECWPDGCEVSRQAQTGAAVQKTTTASMSNAPFLTQFIVRRSPVSIVSIRRGLPLGGDIDHIRKARRLQLLAPGHQFVWVLQAAALSQIEYLHCRAALPCERLPGE
jgi:hypothetical protein